MTTLVMITKLGLHLQTLSHDTHVNITHSPALQSVIQTRSSAFKDKLPPFAPNSLKKHTGPKAHIRMYPKAGSAHRQPRARSQTPLSAQATGPSTWQPVSAPGAMSPCPSRASSPQPCPATRLVELYPHPSLPGAGAAPVPLAACSWLGVGQALAAIPCPGELPWNRCGTSVLGDLQQGPGLHTAVSAAQHCRTTA